MVNTCVGYKCTYRHKKDDNIKLHRFPPDPTLRKKWLIACRLENFQPTDDDRLCSQHFLKSDYKPSSSRHKKDAVPSIFNFPEHLATKNSRKRPAPRDRLPLSPIENLPPSPFQSDVLPEGPSSPKKTKLEASSSPTKAELKGKIADQKRKIKSLNQRLRRKEKKIRTLSGMYDELAKKKLLKENFVEQLKEMFPGLSAEIITNHFKNKDRKPQGYRHSDDAKKFALTTNFYSARAYEHVRKIFSLPHPRSLSAWTSSVDCEAGFFDDVFDHMEKLVEKDHKHADSCLVVDGMGIKESREWDKNKDRIIGFTDYGEGIVLDDPEEIASEAIVFMLVGMRKHWKYPVGYVLANKINADNLHCLIRKSLDLSVEHNIKVRAVTMDGTSTNFSAMKQFGCKAGTDLELLDGSFDFPGYDYKLYFHPDPPHMLKLARNALHEYEIFVDEDGKQIKWSHIKDLHKLQQDEDGLKLGNKLSSRHIKYQRNKMKVKLAAQTLSSSVASAIEFLRKENHPSFTDSDGTVRFIRVVDRLFDLLNSRNQHGAGYKQPLRLKDEKLWCGVIDSSIKYLSTLKTIDGVPLLKTRRKTFVQGFIIAATSVKRMALYLLTFGEDPFIYVLTYKLSQDHLELLFSCCRSSNGFCNNPTVRQLVSALKRILLRSSLMASSHANCMAFEVDESPSIYSLKWSKNRHEEPVTGELESAIPEHILALDMSGKHSIYKTNMLTYIGGYICRTLVKIITCETCRCSLFTKECTEMYEFIKEKDNGGLLYPSADVVTVLSVSENVFKQYCVGKSKMSSGKFLRSRMRVRVLQELYDRDLFKSLRRHDIDHLDPIAEDLHSTQLCKLIAEKYLNVRLFRYQQTLNEEVVHKGKLGMRQQLTKTLIFNGI